jgi:putative two-component system response regulator
MNSHTTLGAAILAGGRSELMAMAERIARGHHERWDGGGYPAGLAGEAIPLEARIVAVADFYDALTHDRPYRLRRGVAETLAMVRTEAGRHFDARVAAALLALEEGPGAPGPAAAALGG